LRRSSDGASFTPASGKDADLQSFQTLVRRLREREGDGFRIFNEHTNSDRAGEPCVAAGSRAPRVRLARARPARWGDPLDDAGARLQKGPQKLKSEYLAALEDVADTCWIIAMLDAQGHHSVEAGVVVQRREATTAPAG